jgi:hypothetical protein
LTTTPSRRGPARGRRRRSWATTPRIPRPPVIAPVPAAGAGGGAHPTRRVHPCMLSRCTWVFSSRDSCAIHALPLLVGLFSPQEHHAIHAIWNRRRC